MMELTANTDAAYKALLDELGHMPDKMHRAEVSAVAKTMKSAKSTLSREIRKQVPIKKQEIDRGIKVPLVKKTQGVVGSAEGSVEFNGRAINSARYDGRPKAGGKVSRNGASAVYRKDQGRKHFKGVQVKAIGGQTAFFTNERTTSGQRRNHYGPQPAQLAIDTGADKKAAEGIGENLMKNVLSQIDRFLKRKKADRG